MVEKAQPETEAVEGHLDGLSDGRIAGWAWYPRHPDRLALVELVADGRIIAASAAGALREDVAAAGKPGACGFYFHITGQFPRGIPIHARVQGDDRSLDLPGGPIVLPATPDTPAPALRNPSSPAVSVNLSDVSGIVGHIDRFGPERIVGWAWYTDDLTKRVVLSMHDGERQIETIEASSWRPDLCEYRQGEGRCGIDVPVPANLRDGAAHQIVIRLAETGELLHTQPVIVQFEKSGAPARDAVPTPKRPPEDAPILFSVIINFYNMQREAERTLTSLMRSYQRDIDDIAYEVLCIDNGSKQPLDQSWVESFGPEFKLIRPSKILPSPCFAINETARQAKGRYVVIMIDGAHVLTPGMLREASDAFAETPDAIFAPRQWWLGGDQRWMSVVGYTPQMEDALFARIKWPSDGYELFRVSTPIFESPNSWFDGMAESNCLFLHAALYERIGGMDERFDVPGGEFTNLDLFRRAAAEVGDRVISPVGEASFHQFHGGTTTNVEDDEKDRRVRFYENRYRAIRGEPFGPVHPERIFLRGRIRTETMLTARQRPLFTGEIGVTERIRPGDINQNFDASAQSYLQSVYAECGLFEGTRWNGQPVRLAPADLVNIQSILHDVRPDVIVTTSRDEGFVGFVRSLLPLLNLQTTRIIRVLKEKPALEAPENLIIGNPYAASTLDAVEKAVGTAEKAVVLFEPQDDDYLPVDAIRTYARFVSFRSYFIFLGTILGQPWLGYSRYWFATAIRTFLDQSPSFVVDPHPERQILSMCVGGYLQRIHLPETFNAISRERE